MAPKRGGKCAETGGGSFHPLLPAPVFAAEEEEDDDCLSKAENGFNIVAAFSAAAESEGNEAARDRSQIESSALPCATEARRPTVQTMVESRVSSNHESWEGSRWAERT